MEALKLKFAAISIIFTACIAFSGGICSLIFNLIFLQERTDYVVILLALCFILCIVAIMASVNFNLSQLGFLTPDLKSGFAI